VGLGCAAELARLAIERGEPARVAALASRLGAGLLASIPGTRLHGDAERSCGSIVNASFPGVEGEAVLHELDREGIAVSTGSACSAAERGPSHVLLAMGLSAEEAHASVRFSLSRENDAADVDRILEVTPRVVARLGALGHPGLKVSA
jgi:cysteine desulfurase